MKFQKHTQQDGYTLLEIVVVVAAVLALSIGTVAVVGTSISKGNAERTLRAAVSTAYREAWDAETGFDEHMNAETVVEQWNNDHEDITFRASGASYELCVFAAHDDIDGEVVAGTCEENPAPEPSEREWTVPKTYEIGSLRCTTDHGGSMEYNEVIYGWSAPSGWSGAEMKYEVEWRDAVITAPSSVEQGQGGVVLSGGSGTHVMTDKVFMYRAPYGEHAGTTTFTITPIADGERLESTSFTTKEVDEANVRACP